MENFLPLRREIIKHWTYDDAETFKLWMTILLRTRYDDGNKTILYRGRLYEIGYGEVAFGRVAWAKEMNMSESKLRSVINKFIEDGMLERSEKSDRSLTIFVVKNFAKYNHQNGHGNSLQAVVSQENESHQSSHRRAITEPSQSHHRAINKEIKIDNIEKNRVTVYDSAFERFWQSYPKKIGKAATYTAWKKRLKNGEFADSIYDAVKNYLEYCERNGLGMQYIKNPCNFIGDSMFYCDFIDSVPDSAELSRRRSASKYVGDD